MLISNKAIKHKPFFPNNYASDFLMLDKGEGVYLYDTNGNKYLDFAAGISVNALGYGNEDLAKTAYDQMKKLIHVSNLYSTEPAVKLAEKLVATGPFEAVHFCNSGTEAIEAAIKYARLYALRTKGTGHHKLMSFTEGFHGRTLGALSVTHKEKYQAPFQPLLDGSVLAKYNDIADLKAKLDFSYAAVIIEVVQGEGGLEVIDPGFAKELQALCQKLDVLVIIDEVQTGLSRTGSLFAWQDTTLTPDILALSKPLAAGLPLGATLIPAKVNKLVQKGEHGTTFGGGPVTTAVALKVFEKLSDPAFIQEVADKGKYLAGLLEELSSRYDILGEVKGKGLLAGMVLKDSEKLGKLYDTAIDHGLLLLVAGKDRIRIAPPLVITKDELKKGVEILEEVIRTL
ncbi:MAG: aspartate aminotransferase family protein [Spirochaetales bacterium]|nr:aspartate aminotransferase family protein [Spirochaetales bacterium]